MNSLVFKSSVSFYMSILCELVCMYAMTIGVCVCVCVCASISECVRHECAGNFSTFAVCVQAFYVFHESVSMLKLCFCVLATILYVFLAL